MARSPYDRTTPATDKAGTPTPTEGLVAWQPGEPVSAAKLNRMSGAVAGSGVVVQPVRQNPVRPIRVHIQEVQLNQDGWNFFWVKLLDEDGDPTNTLIRVARPWLLRRTSFHNQTWGDFTYQASPIQLNQRSATFLTKTRTHEIRPAYLVQQRITIGRIATMMMPAMDESEQERFSVSWVDLNNDARGWKGIHPGDPEAGTARHDAGTVFTFYERHDHP